VNSLPETDGLQPVVIVGIEGDGPATLLPRVRAWLDAATFLAGGRRHLELIGPGSIETFTITNNLQDLADRLRRRGPEERCVVLASGDPLFFGIGHFLGESLGRDQIVVEPAVSSMQRAFARLGLAWHEASIASIHGRPLARTLLPLLGRAAIGLFTQDGGSPAEVASFFLDRDLDDYDAWVGENLGTGFETVTACSLIELADRQFGALNVLILRRRGEAAVERDDPPGIPDTGFARPDVGPVLLTHADVRVLVLARFRHLPEGPLWDIGAGLGGVAVELARAFRGREVVAVERADEQLVYLRANRLRHAAYNLRLIADEAPECLAKEEPPAAVFVGGSGGRLDAILDLCLDRVLAGGTLAATFVGLENLMRTLGRLGGAGWTTDVTHVQIAPSQPLAGLTTFVPQRPVWLVRSVRPKYEETPADEHI
jgi:precorrin-6Y C5,15-methyltransferase (decarboxylating)